MNRAARLAYRLIGPVVFIALAWFTDLSQVGDIWARGAPGLMVGAAGLNALIIVIKAWRWRRLMRLQGLDYGYVPAARYYAISCAMGAWTPGRLGDFSKALAVHRDTDVGLGRAASSVIADRLLDGVALALVASAGAWFLPGRHGAWIAAGGLVGAAAAAWLLLRKARDSAAEAGLVRRGARRIVGAFGRLGPAGREMGDAIDGLAALVRPALGVSAAATVVATLVTFLQGWLVARSLGIDVGFWTLSVALAAVSITSLLPVSVAGIGTREATLALFLAPGGISMPSILGFSVAYFVIISGSVALMGAAAWVVKPSSDVKVAA